MGMDDNFTRISLSTAELEEQNGDMLFDKVPNLCQPCLLVIYSTVCLVDQSTPVRQVAAVLSDSHSLRVYLP